MIIQSCSNSNAASEKQYLALLATSRDLRCQILDIKYQNDSMWDTVSVILDQKLPHKNIIESDRANMLTLRNAGIIKEFKVFQNLDSSIQKIVFDAGAQDAKNALKLKEVLAKFEDYQKEKDMFLMQVEKVDPAKSKKYMEELMKIDSLEKCD